MARRWRPLAALGAVFVLAGSNRLGAATIVVNDLGDDLHPACATTGVGVCSLRDAITFANAFAGPDLIHFAISGPGVKTIRPTLPLPDLTDDAGVTIDGYSQPGSSPNTRAVGNDAVILIEIDASRVPYGKTGFFNIVSDNNLIRGLAIGGYGVDADIALVGASNNVVVGNYIGTDASGMVARLSRMGIYALVEGGGHVIGGTDPGSRNVVVSGDLGVIRLDGSGHNVVQGNYVGTNRDGSAALFFSSLRGGGIFVGSPGNLIGGPGMGAGNLVSGNRYGIGVGASANSVIGNLVGTDPSGTMALPNQYDGIVVGQDATNTQILTNVVAFNGGVGITVADRAVGARINGNRIWSNASRGIQLGDQGVPRNDPLDLDQGPNGLQNFLVLTSARSSSGSTRIGGFLESAPSATFGLEFFSNDVCDGSGHGEGRILLGASSVTTDDAGKGTFDVAVPMGVGSRERVTATATDASGNTSEFSACVWPAARFNTVAPCRAVDSRDPPGPFGGPPLSRTAERSFKLAGRCGIPDTAQAVSFNFTVTGAYTAGNLVIYPAGDPQPTASTINYSRLQTRANNAVLPLGLGGAIAVRCDQVYGDVHFVVDVNGYFE